MRWALEMHPANDTHSVGPRVIDLDYAARAEKFRQLYFTEQPRKRSTIILETVSFHKDDIGYGCANDLQDACAHSMPASAAATTYAWSWAWLNNLAPDR